MTFLKNKKTTFLALFALILAAVCYAFYIGKYVFWPAAWLGLAFWYAANKQLKWYYFLGFGLPIFALSGFWATFGVVNSIKLNLLLAIGLTFIFFIPFLVEKIFLYFSLNSIKTSSFLNTLIFPSIFTLCDFLAYKLNPYGSWTALAYSQYHNRFVAIWASLFGIWGISFVIAWTVSVGFWLYRNRLTFQLKKHFISIIYFCLITVLFGYSLVQLTTQKDSINDGILVSGVAVNDVIFESEAELMDELFNQTEQEAKKGAKIISWAEANGIVNEVNLQTYLDKSSRIAAEHKIYLFTTFWVKSSKNLTQNQIVGFDPNGQVILTYNKNRPLPSERIIRGDGKIPVVQTEYGKIAVAICFDNDHPELISQAGKLEADLLLSPSRDWHAINPRHSYIVSFRAIENGLHVLKSTNFGDSVAWDSSGRVLAKNSFDGDYKVRTVRFNFNKQSKNTLYNKVGDFILYLTGFFILFYPTYQILLKRKSAEND